MKPAIILCAFALLACGGRDDLDGSRTRAAGLPERAPAWSMPLGQRRAVLDLFDNRPSLVVHREEALHIDCGSPDFAKYIEGGYRSPWHLGVSDRGVAAALVDGLAGELYLPIDRDRGGVHRADDGAVRIAFYARAAADDQLVSVFLNEHRLGDVSMPETEWSWYGLEAPASAVREGENKLRFYFRNAGEVDGVRTAAAFARIAVGGRRPVPGRELRPALAAGEVSLESGSLAALTVDAAGRLSTYARIPADAPALIVAPAGEGTEVWVAVDGAVRWRGKATEDWHAVAVDLAPEAGAIARIDLGADGPVHWGRPQLAARAPADAPGDAQRVSPEHVIVWSVSSLRADRVTPSRAPTMARLAREGVHVRRLIAAAPRPGASHATLLTGRYPTGDSLPDHAVTLGQRFRSAGFAAALVSGNGFVNDTAGFARGFDRYENPMRLRHPHGAGALWQRAKKVVARNREGRSFVYIATVEPHLPYTPSDAPEHPEHEAAHTAQLSEAIRAGKVTATAAIRAWLTELYDAEVRDNDAALAGALADLAEIGVLERTAIVVVGDHGEELFERGNIGHGETLFREVLASPLIVWFPPAVPARVVDDPVDAVDVYATVLDLAGITANPEAQGRSVLAAGEPDRLAFAHLPGHGRAVIAGRYKLVVPRHGGQQLYDLADDPGERANLMGERPAIERYLRNAFGLHVAYEAAWQKRRWGTVADLEPAFAADHGM